MTSIADRQLADWLEAVYKLGRAPAEWHGKTPDSVPSAAVRDRVRRTWGSVCYLSGVEIRPGRPFEIEHVIPLSMGGLNAERNMRPALSIEHRKKTRREAKERAKATKAGRAAFGTKAPPKQKIQNRGFTPRDKPKSDKLPIPNWKHRFYEVI